MRVVILGPGAAGKSTFAKRLGEETGVSVTELDSVFWSSELEPLSPEKWTEVQTELIAADSWILDGDLGPHDVLRTRLERADTVVMFDPSPIKCAWRALRRSREQWGFWIWLLTWRRREKPVLLDAIERHAPAARLELVTSDDEAAHVISKMSSCQRHHGEVRCLVLRADFGGGPLWDDDSDGENDICPNPASLGVSPSLSADLMRWQEEYADTLDHTYPPDSAFPNETDRIAWEDRGISLAERLRHELGGTITIRLDLQSRDEDR